MKIHRLILLIFCSSIAIGSFAQKNNVEKEFMKTVEQTRDRIMTMHGEGELATVQYEEEREVVREAEQVAQLLKEGKEVDNKTLKDWISKLNRLGVPQNEEGEGVQLKDESWMAKEKGLKKQLEAHEAALEKQMQAEKISKKEYQRKKEMLETMNTELKKLNGQMNSLEAEMQKLESRIKQFKKDM